MPVANAGKAEPGERTIMTRATDTEAREPSVFISQVR